MTYVEDLAKRTGGISTTNNDELQHAVDLATALVDRLLEDKFREVPEALYTEVVLRTAYAVYKAARGTEDTFLGADGTTLVSAPNDPLRKSYDLLKPYLQRLA